MTRLSRVDVECQKCGKSICMTVWETLNASLDPDYKQKLLRGEINIFKCPSCGFSHEIYNSLLYHDMKQKYLVYVFNPEYAEDPNFLSSFAEDGHYVGDTQYDPPDMEQYFKNPHHVFSMEELVRYVVFRDKLFAHYEHKREPQA